MHNKFYGLMQDYAKLTGVEHVGRLIDGHPIRVNDVLFSLVFDAKKDANTLFIYGDLGLVSKQNAVEEESTLLAVNSVFYPDSGACVAISPTNGHAILCLKAALDVLTAELLQQRLLAAVGVASAWRAQSA